MKKKLIHCLIGTWLILSVLSIGYNTYNVIPEVKNWYFLSDGEKRHKIFGDLYDFILFVDSHMSSNTTVVIVSKEGFSFFLAKYYLYPKKVFFVQDGKNIEQEKKPYDYIVSFDKKIQKKGFILDAKLTNKQTPATWYFYKIE